MLPMALRSPAAPLRENIFLYEWTLFERTALSRKVNRKSHNLFPFVKMIENLGGVLIPAGIWCENDVVLTSMRRDYVASTLIRRHFGTKCPLGYILLFLFMHFRFELYNEGLARSGSDGLNSMMYTRLALEFRDLYTWIYVQANEAVIMKV